MGHKARWNFNQEQRLVAAEELLANGSGRNVVEAYRRWFRVGRKRAVKELRMLRDNVQGASQHLGGIQTGDVYKSGPPKRRTGYRDGTLDYSDATFAFIAGYTSGGAPFGVTWEELESQHEVRLYRSETDPIEFIDDPFDPFDLYSPIDAYDSFDPFGPDTSAIPEYPFW